MSKSAFADPWQNSLATEFQYLCELQLALKIGRQHSIEIVAALSGKSKASSLIPANALAAEIPDLLVDIKWDLVEKRILKLIPSLSKSQMDNIIDLLFCIRDEEYSEQTALAKRLIRNIAKNCDFHGEFGFTRVAWLTRADWYACGEIARQDDFEENLAVPLSVPAIASIAISDPDPDCEDRYPVESGAILNIIAFLCPDNWKELLARYQPNLHTWLH